MNASSSLPPDFRNGWPWWSVLLLMGYLWLFLRRMSHPELIQMDDAWMFIRYAEHILQGEGIRWNPDGPPTYGCTSTAYLFWITLVKGLLGRWISDWDLLLYSSMSFMLAGVALTFELAYRTVVRVRRSEVFAFLALVLTGKSWFVHGSSGIDTGLSLFCMAGFLFAAHHLREKDGLMHKFGFACLGWVCVEARPENALVVAGVTLGYLLINQKWNWRSLWPIVLGMGGLVGVSTLAKWLYFGDFLPLSFYAKAPGFYQGYLGWIMLNPADMMHDYLKFILPFSLLFLLCWSPQKRSHQGVAIGLFLPLLLTMATLFSRVPIMGADIRFYIPLTPAIVWMTALIFRGTALPPDRQGWTQRGFILAAWCGLVLSFFPSFVAWNKGRIEKKVYAEMAPPSKIYGDWKLREYAEKVATSMKLLPDSLGVAGTEHGYLGALMPAHPVYDLAGLHEPLLHQGFSGAAYVERVRPAVIWLPHRDYTVMHHEIRTSAFFQENYDYYPEVYMLGLALRRDLIPLFCKKGAFSDILTDRCPD